MNKRIALVLTSLILATLLISPIASDAAEIRNINGANISTFDNELDISAGNTVKVTVSAVNVSDDTLIVKLHPLHGNISVSFQKDEYIIDPNEAAEMEFSISADKYLNNCMMTAPVVIGVYNYGTEVTEETTITFTLNVSNGYTVDSEFNRILGVFPPLPAPLNTPLVSAAVSMILWFAIACVIILAIYFLIVRRLFKDYRNDSKSIMKITGTTVMAVILLYGFCQCLNIYGADPIIIDIVKKVTDFIFIILGAIIIWNLYSAAISALMHRAEAKGKVANVDDAVIPLFILIGKVVLFIATAGAVLSVFGFDLIALLTGAGILALAVSLGAQNTLQQFFAGLTILITRPFTIGDMVTLGDGKTYEVIRIGVLNCEFKNWLNHEYTTMPNTMVSNFKINNITKKTKAFRIVSYFDVDYDADIEKAKEIILEVAKKNEHVLLDGQYSKPSVRLERFDSSSVVLMLSCYIDDFENNLVVSGQLNEAGYRALKDAGIECPFDTYDIHISN